MAAQADLGVSSEAELCALKEQTPEKFCAECIAAPAWDVSLKIFTTDEEAGTCFVCKQVCIDLYTRQDVRRVETQGSAAVLKYDQVHILPTRIHCTQCHVLTALLPQCYACMSYAVPETNAQTGFSGKAYLQSVFGGTDTVGGPLFWLVHTKPQYPDVCSSIKDYCMKQLSTMCWVPLEDRLCRNVDTRRRAEEYFSISPMGSQLEGRRKLQDSADMESCKANVRVQYRNENFMDYDFWNPRCPPLAPIMDAAAIAEGYTCAESAFVNGLCLSYMPFDGECDTACMNTEGFEQCQDDGGDCEEAVVCECEEDWMGDGFCDTACNSELCNFDCPHHSGAFKRP